MELKMVHEDNDKKQVTVSNQIQREAFAKHGFVEAPAKEQPKPENGEPAMLPRDSAEADEFEQIKDENAGKDVSLQKQNDEQDAKASSRKKSGKETK